MSYSHHSQWGHGRSGGSSSRQYYERDPASGFQRDHSPAAGSNQPTGGSDTQSSNMNAGDDDDLFTYRGRNNNSGPAGGRLTAHVAPVAAGRRPGNQTSFTTDQKPGARFNNPNGSHYQSGPPRRPPTSSHRFAADEYYTNSSRYDRDFSRDDTFSEPPGSGLLGDLITGPAEEKYTPVESEPPDIFKSRSVARNPSPDRFAGPDSFRSFDRPRSDSFDHSHQIAEERMPNYQPPQRPAVVREDPRTASRNTFDRSAYPARGSNRIEENRSLPAVYELPKIQKKVNLNEEEKPEDKIVRLRVEHAKLEMRIQNLEKVVESARSREQEFRRGPNAATLADNKAFSDTIKLLSDAQRQLDAARRDYSFKDDVIKKMMQKSSSGDKNADKPKQEQVQVLSTDFLDEKREEREEVTDSTSKLEFYDGADHWCQQCNYFPATVQEYLSHLHSSDHWAKNKPNSTAPWPLIKRASIFDQDRSLAAIRGTQFMIPCHGYYCAICKSFQGDAEVAEEHLFSIGHNKMVQRFFMSKPEYEHVYNKDRKSAQSKAEADARKQKREAEDKRIRDEEAQKKREEEENRKREKEIRDKLAEEARNKNRIRELEDKREKEKLRRDRDRMKEKERERERKRKSRIQMVSSDDEVVSSDSDEVAPPKLDPKLSTPCFVVISAEDSKRAERSFNTQGKVIRQGKYTYTATSSGADAVWTMVSNATQKPANPAPVAKASVTADFDDDSNSDFSLSTVTSENATVVSAISSAITVKEEVVSPQKLHIDEDAKSESTSSRATIPNAESPAKPGSHMEEMILSALTDCLTPPVITEDDEPKKHKKMRTIETITSDDPNDDDNGVSADTEPVSDAVTFPTLSLDDLVTKSP